jgi:hypothetical protein
MNLNQLTKQFRREIVAHPKQAACLGLVGIVALYFWAPLMIGWFSKSQPDAAAGMAEKPVAESSQPPSSSAPAPAGDPSSANAGKVTMPGWQELVEWIERDPRTRPAGPLRGGHDPFGAAKVEIVARKPEKPKDPEPEVTPQTLNLVLSGTILGPANRVARINGQTCKKGETITVTKDGKRFAFTLTEVEARHVVLVGRGKSYKLEIPGPPSKNQIELSVTQ